MRILLVVVALSMFTAALVGGTCVMVSSDKIVVGDLIEAVPLFLTLDPATLVGFSPLPGTERVLTGHEISLLLTRHGIANDTAAPLHNICVQRSASPIAKENMKAALASALAFADAELELLDFSEEPLPPGRLEFRRSGLSQPSQQKPDAPVIWRGRLIYDGQHSASVWAKVTVLVDRPLFFAATDIESGVLIRPEQVRETRERQFPFSGPALASSGEISGKVARRAISSGQKILPSMLDERRDVARGDKVHVRVLDGLAYLAFDGVAISSGQKGDSILVHNYTGGRNFRAVIEDKGEVLVQSSPEK